ncbi:MAG: imidazole glycerol phosphate synthase subunit HisH [Proteobacteria bacterium]|nr:imidazole glycerol phosphate synthase subunit HisH [Pseudomonadota bacterium]MCL2308063.1 imidazole glycerol phosphate synthase subunit HisH [Pseudomonadota bacterium]
MTRAVILDTGCANLASLRYAVQRLGYAVEISGEAAAIRAADRLFLPGVGTAQAAMRELRARGLVELIRACTQPVLGICLGMQLLGSQSEEGGGGQVPSQVPLLGVIDAPVQRMKGDFPLPHMGWNVCAPKAGHPLFEGIDSGDYFYFVHGFAMPLGDWTIARGEYGNAFSAAVQRGHFYGVQFHPERSGRAGAQLLRNFMENIR